MIQASELALAGKINKTHGTAGELSVSFFSDAIAEAISAGSCLIMDIDGIFTPFYAEAVRPRGTESLLVTIDGIDSKEQAAAYVGKDVYVDKSIADEADEAAEAADGFYAAQLIGYQAADETAGPLGEIVDVDDSTENALFIVAGPEGREIYLPIADELITDIDTDNKIITFDLPSGLLSL